jgi:beta-galactosidase
LDSAGLARLLGTVLDGAGVQPVSPGAPPGVEVVRRRGEGGSWLFVINHTEHPQEVPACGLDLVTGSTVDGTVRLPAGGYAVVRY